MKSRNHQLYDRSSLYTSRKVTELFSTSFSLGIKTLAPKLRDPIFSIYGMVRLADEIVDTFHDQDQEKLLDDFQQETYAAIERGFSTNPILHSFQMAVNDYHIDLDLIQAFFDSMAMDLNPENYDRAKFDAYIYGSAEVVGLMCLAVFVEGDKAEYDKLIGPAKSLGAAFQKVNFLRDLKDDFQGLGRVYFPNVDFNNFSFLDKQRIEDEIAKDFHEAFKGIVQLPESSRMGVYLAYIYYLRLFKKIRKTTPEKIQEARIRVPNIEKMWLLANTMVKGYIGVF